jgi:hypothetical protein
VVVEEEEVDNAGDSTLDSPVPPSKRPKVSATAERESSDEKFLLGLGEIVKTALGSSGPDASTEEHRFGQFVAISLSNLGDENVKDETIIAIQLVLQNAKKTVREKNS